MLVLYGSKHVKRDVEWNISTKILRLVTLPVLYSFVPVWNRKMCARLQLMSLTKS